MSYKNRINHLPDKFKNLNFITSIEVRSKLEKTISDIVSLIKKQIIIPDSKSKTLVDRYFKYLLESLENPVKLNRRSNWLCSYSDIILSHLLTHEYRGFIPQYIKVQEGYVGKNYFLQHLLKVTDLIIKFRILKRGRFDIDRDIIYYLDRLLDLSDYFVQEYPDRLYEDLLYSLKDLINYLYCLILFHLEDNEIEEHLLVQALHRFYRQVVFYKKYNVPKVFLKD